MSHDGGGGGEGGDQRGVLRDGDEPRMGAESSRGNSYL